MDFSDRARQLRTPAQAKRYDEEDRMRELAKGGLTKEKYWEEKVRSTQDILTYYQLYFPEYPEQVQLALTERMRQIFEKCEEDDEYKQQILEKKEQRQKQREAEGWNYKKDIEESRERILASKLLQEHVEKTTNDISEGSEEEQKQQQL